MVLCIHENLCTLLILLCKNNSNLSISHKNHYALRKLEQPVPPHFSHFNPCSHNKAFDLHSFTPLYPSFYPSTFVYNHISTKIRFLCCLHSSVALWCGPMVGNKGKTFEIWVCRLLENSYLLDFSWNLRVSWRVLRKKLTKTFLCACL